MYKALKVCPAASTNHGQPAALPATLPLCLRQAAGNALFKPYILNIRFTTCFGMLRWQQTYVLPLLPRLTPTIVRIEQSKLNGVDQWQQLG